MGGCSNDDNQGPASTNGVVIVRSYDL
jgi:hypothetical protein